MTKNFVSLLLIMLSICVDAETLHYTVVHDNKSVGKIRIDKITTNDIVQFNFESNVHIKMLISINVYDKMDVMFKNNQLMKSYLYRTLNGNVRVKNVATWNGHAYTQTSKDNNTTTINHKIYYTTASLYYYEPINYTQVYSEKFQKMIPIKPAGNNRYVLELPNGNKAYYSYANGTCSLVEAETDWAKLKFVRNH